MEMEVDEARGGIRKDEGFTVNVKNAFNQFTIDFKPPCLVRCVGLWGAAPACCDSLGGRRDPADPPPPPVKAPLICTHSLPPLPLLAPSPARLPTPKPQNQRHNFTKDMSLILYAAPTAPGWCRVNVTFVGSKATNDLRPKTPGMPPAIAFVADLVTKCTPLFHALIQNNIIGVVMWLGVGWV
jgi:hypothetical protein